MVSGAKTKTLNGHRSRRSVHIVTKTNEVPVFPQTQQLTEEEEARLKDLFDQYDDDGSGSITQDELYDILNQILHNKATAIHIVHVSIHQGSSFRNGNPNHWRI